MSNYTTQVRFLCETYAGLAESVGGTSARQVIATAAPRVFDFDFPIFDEDYRLPLEVKILRHYYTREISEETVGLWKLRLESRMNEIMPYYNQLYASQLKMIDYDPFTDVDLTTDHTRDNGSTTVSDGKTATRDGGADKTVLTHGTDVTNSGTDRTVTGTEFSPGAKKETRAMGGAEVSTSDWTLYSDTPQGSISRVDLADNAYLTNATKVERVSTPNPSTGTITTEEGKGGKDTTDTDSSLTHGHKVATTGTEKTDTEYGRTVDGTSEGNVKFTGTEEYLQHVKGKTAGRSYSALLEEWRRTFLNIDVMILEELSDLFFGLWE